jgi:hypothetical protein
VPSIASEFDKVKVLTGDPGLREGLEEGLSPRSDPAPVVVPASMAIEDALTVSDWRSLATSSMGILPVAAAELVSASLTCLK